MKERERVRRKRKETGKREIKRVIVQKDSEKEKDIIEEQIEKKQREKKKRQKESLADRESGIKNRQQDKVQDISKERERNKNHNII